MSRTVVDTNVSVSAVILPRSVPRQAFDRANEDGRLLISVATIAELDEVLRRPRFDKYVAEKRRLEFLATLIQEAELIDVTEVITDCRDPKDNRFLELAVDGTADCIITGDQDLLFLDPYRGISILTPQAYLARQK
jgi:putative PIN family toxin of toxin-antitoxin system